MGRCHFINGGGVKTIGEEDGADIAFDSQETMVHFVKTMFGKDIVEGDDVRNIFRGTPYTFKDPNSYWLAHEHRGAFIAFVRVDTFIDFVKKFLNKDVTPRIIKETGNKVEEWFADCEYDVAYYPCFFEELNELVKHN